MIKTLLLFGVLINFLVASDGEQLSEYLPQLSKNIEHKDTNKSIVINETDSDEIKMLKTEIKFLKTELGDYKWNFKQCESEKSSLKENYISKEYCVQLNRNNKNRFENSDYDRNQDSYRQPNNFNVPNNQNEFKVRESDYVKLLNENRKLLNH